MYALTLPWEQTNDYLMWAIDTRAHLRVTVRLAREWEELSSQFLAGEQLRTILVTKFAEPWTERLLAGQLLPCSFRKGHKKYLFVSAILGQKEVEIDGQMEPVYVLTWPEGLQEMQRRLYYRAAVPSQYDLKVKFYPAVAAIGSVPEGKPLAEGRLVDVSAGGALVDLSETTDVEPENGYLLEIEMLRPEKPALVLARTRRMSDDNGGLCRCGMQFLSLDHTPRGHDTRMRLARFANYLRYSEPAEQTHQGG